VSVAKGVFRTSLLGRRVRTTCPYFYHPALGSIEIARCHLYWTAVQKTYLYRNRVKDRPAPPTRAAARFRNAPRAGPRAGLILKFLAVGHLAGRGCPGSRAIEGRCSGIQTGAGPRPAPGDRGSKTSESSREIGVPATVAAVCSFGRRYCKSAATGSQCLRRSRQRWSWKPVSTSAVSWPEW